MAIVAVLHQWFLTMVPMEEFQILIALIQARMVEVEVIAHQVC